MQTSATDSPRHPTPPNLPEGVSYTLQHNIYTIYPANKMDNYCVGAVEEGGKEILPMIYQAIQVFEIGIIFQQNGLYGFALKNGVITIPANYQKLNFGESTQVTHLLVAVLHDKWGILDTKGKIIVPVLYRYVGTIRDRIILQQADGLYGIAHLNGEILAPIKYQQIQTPERYFMEDYTGSFLHQSQIPEKYTVVLVKAKRKWGVVQLSTGKEIVPAVYDITPEIVDNYIIIQDVNYQKGLLNEKGEMILPTIYQYIQSEKYEDKQYFLIQQHDKWGLSTHEGELALPIRYDSLIGIHNSTQLLFLAQIEGQSWIMDMQEKCLTAHKYDALVVINEYIYAIKNSKEGILSLEGKVLLPIIYDKITYDAAHPFPAVLDGKLGYIDKNGQIIIPFLYDNTAYYDLGDRELLIVKKDGKYGYIDITGKIKIDFQFEEAYPFETNKNTTRVKRKASDKKWQVINKEGSIIPPLQKFKYKQLTQFNALISEVVALEKALQDAHRQISGIKVLKFSDSAAKELHNVSALLERGEDLADILLESKLVDKYKHANYVADAHNGQIKDNLESYYQEGSLMIAVIKGIIASAAWTWFFDEYSFAPEDILDLSKIADLAARNVCVPNYDLKVLQERNAKIEKLVTTFHDFVNETTNLPEVYTKMTFAPALSDLSNTDNISIWYLRGSYALIYIEYTEI